MRAPRRGPSRLWRPLHPHGREDLQRGDRRSSWDRAAALTRTQTPAPFIPATRTWHDRQHGNQDGSSCLVKHCPRIVGSSGGGDLHITPSLPRDQQRALQRGCSVLLSYLQQPPASLVQSWFCSFCETEPHLTGDLVNPSCHLPGECWEWERADLRAAG